MGDVGRPKCNPGQAVYAIITNTKHTRSKATEPRFSFDVLQGKCYRISKSVGQDWEYTVADRNRTVVVSGCDIAVDRDEIKVRFKVRFDEFLNRIQSEESRENEE
jgi:hypothetical protein